MTRGVALETSGRLGSVALALDGVTLARAEFAHGLKHAATLIPEIDRLLREAGWAVADIGELYISVGPGSFTGLRIAVTLAKTWALARGVKIVAVPSVRAIVENLPPEAAHAAIALDAKRGQIFTASYSRDDAGLWQLTRPARLDTLAAVAAADPKPLTLTGEGLDYHPHPSSPDVVIAPKDLWPARAETVARLGHAMARRGEFADPLRLTPTYVRLPEAEEKWQLEHPATLP